MILSLIPNQSIDSKDVILEPIVQYHAPILFDKLQAKELYTYIPFDPPASVETLKAQYERWEKRKSRDGSEIWFNYVVLDKSENVFVGTVQATYTESHKVYIAYQVFPSCWRRGFAKKACTVLISYLFSVHNVHVISALVDTRNEASWLLLESIGFQRIETIENADYFKGTQSNEYLYEVEHANWLAVSKD